MGAIVGGEPPVDIERFGAIQADLAAGVPRGDVLATARLTDAQLAATTEHWLAAMAQEVRRGRTVLSQRYARAYIARRPELLRDPEDDVERLEALAPGRPRPAAAPAPSEDAAPGSAVAARSDATPRFVPSYLLGDAASAQRAPVQVVETAPLPPIPALPPLAARPRPVMPVVQAAQLPAGAPSAAPSPLAKPSAKQKGTMIAMEIPASFKVLPFASDRTPPPSSRAAPPSPRAPLSEGAPPPPRAPASQPAPRSLAALVSPAAAPAASAPSRPAITGTAAFELPEHLRNMPLGGAPNAPPPPAPSPPGAPPGSPTGASPPAAAPPLPSLEEYVRVGVDLGATSPDRVDAVLAQARWTRATWAAVDQVYRARLAREPALQTAFQAALAAERARRTPTRR